MVITVLKIWVHSYRGSGRTKYAHEMLHLFHNMHFRAVITQNWLQNPTGKANAFVEIDLVQEHLNLIKQKVYKADGDAHSWEWLEVVSPCVEILRKLSTKLNIELGTRQGSKHSMPDLRNDISRLMNTLDKHNVYRFQEGRMVDEKDGPVPDILAKGMAALTHGTTGPSPVPEQSRALSSSTEAQRDAPLAVPSPEAPLASTTLPQADVDEVDEPDEDAASDEETGLGGWEDSPTLTRLDEDDVELDMDELDLGMDGDDDFSEDDEGEEENEGGEGTGMDTL